MRKRKLFTVLGGACLILLIVALSLTTACAPAVSTAAEFFKGKTIDIIVPHGAGATYDLQVRAVAPILANHLGAYTTIKNLGGGGGLEGFNGIFDAKPDGLTLGYVQLQVPLLNNLMDAPGIKYDISKYSVIGGGTSEGMVFVISAVKPYKSVADLKAAKNLKLGAIGVLGNYALCTVTVPYALDLDAKVLAGLADKDYFPAMIRGEIDGGAQIDTGALVRLKQGAHRVLFAFGEKRLPSFPDLPAITELVNLPQEKKDLFSMWVNELGPGGGFVGPPGLPKDKIEFLQAAWEKSCKDPTVIKVFEDAAGYSKLPWLSKKDWESRIEKGLKRKAEIKGTFEKLTKQYFLKM